jgi:hypothetical protein
MKSVDSTGQFARITTFMRDESGDKIAKLKLKLQKLLKFSQKTIQSNHYAKLVFQKGTGYLLNNLLSSLAFAFY